MFYDHGEIAGSEQEAGTYDFARTLGSATNAMSGIGLFDVRTIGSTQYYRWPDKSVLPDACVRPRRPWVKIAYGSTARVPLSPSKLAEIVSPSPFGTDQPLSILADIGARLVSVGRDTIDGQQTTKYDVQFDVQALNEHGPGSLRILPGGTIHATLWLDKRQRMRRLHVDGGAVRWIGSGSRMTIDVNLTDYGTRVDAVAPPPNQICPGI